MFNITGGGTNATEYTRIMTTKVSDKIQEYYKRNTGVAVELQALGSAIEACFKVAHEV